MSHLRMASPMSSFQFQGEERFDASRQALWDFLTDLRNMPRCAPNLQHPEFPDPNTLHGKLASGFSFVQGSLDLTVEVKERDEPQAARVLITARGMGSRAVIDVALN